MMIAPTGKYGVGEFWNWEGNASIATGIHGFLAAMTAYEG